MQSARYAIVTSTVLATLLTLPNALTGDTPRFLFGSPQLVEGVSTRGSGEDAPSLSADGLDLYFSSNAGDSEFFSRILVAHRDSIDSPFGQATPLATLEAEGVNVIQPSISTDGLELYYVHESQSDADPAEIWTASRSSLDAPFENPRQVFVSNQVGWYAPSLSHDGLSLYIQGVDSSELNDSDVYVARRGSAAEPWGEPELVAELGDAGRWQSRPSMSNDNLALFFFDNYGDSRAGNRNADIAMIVRSDPDAPWSAPINLGNAINSSQHEDFPRLAPDGRSLYFSRFDATAEDAASFFNSADIWQSPLLPFETVGLSGKGDGYVQDFDSLSPDPATQTPLPLGWTFTANDVVFNNTTTDAFPARRRNYAGVYNAGEVDDSDRALVTDYSLEEGGELHLRAEVQDAPVQALRLAFDVEAWQVLSGVGTDKEEAAFHVILEADTGDGFSQVADLGTVTTGATLSRPPAFTRVNGNDPEYRVTYDSGPLDLDVPEGALLRVRWMSTEVSQSNVVFGLDNVSLRFAAPGDANIDGLFNSADLIEVLARGEYNDDIADNSTWSEGDWNNDLDFDSSDLVDALATGSYDSGGAAVMSVPEPTAAVPLLAGILSLVCWQTFTRSRARRR